MKVKCNNAIIIDNLKIADNFTKRLIGLLNKKEVKNEGLILINCTSIHCFFMKFTIDAVYLSKDMIVLYKEKLKPWQVGRFVKNTKHILELPEGLSKNISVGDKIEII